MKSGLAKSLIAVSVGGGSIFLTMQLTNQADISLNIGGLELEDLPKVPEDEINPTKPPKEEEKKKQEDGNSGDQKGEGGGEKGTQPPSSSGQITSNGSSSDSSSQTDKSIEERLRMSVTEINSKIPGWNRATGTFSTGYELMSRIQTLAGLLKELEKKNQEQESK